jgi:FtsZ-interacting cell division protein YlmF
MNSGLWYRILVYLGLKEEPEEGDDAIPERATPRSETRKEDRQADRSEPVDDPELAPARSGTSDPRTAASEVGQQTASSSAVQRVVGSNVRALRPTRSGRGRTVRLAIVEVGAFEDVEAIGSRYRTGQPVLFDVIGTDRPVARRVVDVVSGLTYALRGSMTKVGPRAFLLVPDGIELPDDELGRLRTLGYQLPAEGDR